MKTIPLAVDVEMATHNDIYQVWIDSMFDKERAEDDGLVITAFHQWLDHCGDARIKGYGINSGRKLWQVSREIQRQAFKICKQYSMTLNQKEKER
tara:strand:- start:3490 stop:3774 length:285 start_codon:yes stop_codon:yes gene_type:complete